MMSEIDRFEFAFAPSYARAARPFGIKPSNAWVAIDDLLFDARFGPWRVTTPLTNITDVAVTGPYRFFKTAGSARLGFTDRGLTFASNGKRGVLVTFATAVTGMDPLGVIHHPELTVTVAEIDRLAAVLEQRITAARAAASGSRSGT
jgi:hypothetical protein